MTESQAIDALTNLLSEDVKHIIDSYKDKNNNEHASIMITGYDLDYIVKLLVTGRP